MFWIHERTTVDQAGPDTPQMQTGMAASPTHIGNGVVDVDIDSSTGAVTGLKDGDGRQWLETEGIRPVVLDDPSDTWSHGVIRYEGEEQPCELLDVKAAETGPLRATVRLTYRWRNSLIYEDLYLLAGTGGLGLRLRVDWHEKHQLLKLVVPVAGAGPAAWVALPYGAVLRPSDGREEVMQRWVDIEAQGGGLACVSDVTYGYDLSAGRLRLTVLRSPRWADHGASSAHDRGIESSYTDQGSHRVSLLLLPHAGDWASARIPQRAEEHCTDFRAVTETWHTGPLGSNYRGTAVAPDNVAVPVVKRAEDGSGWVARVVEMAGKRSQAQLTIEGLGREWKGTLGPFEVKTLLFPDGTGSEVIETDIPELQPWK